MAQEKKKQEPVGDVITPEKAQELFDKLNEMMDQFGMEVKIFKKDYIQTLDEREAALKEREDNLAPRETELMARANALAESEEKNKSLLAEAVAKETEAKLRMDEMKATETAFEAIRAGLEKQASEIATKKAELFAASEKLASELYEKRIQETEEEVQKIRVAALANAQKTRDAALADAQKTREAAETAAQSTRTNAQKNVESALTAADQQVKTILDNAKINAKLLVDEATSQAAQVIKSAEEKAKDIQEKAAQDTEALDKQIKELIQEKTKLENENRKYFAENVEIHIENANLESECKKQKENFDNKTALYEKTLADFKTLRVQLESSGRDVAQFSEDISNLVTREQKLNGKEKELKDLESALSLEKKRNERKDESLREMQEDIDGEVEKRYGAILERKDSMINALNVELNDLQNSKEANLKIATKFDNLTRELGENPVEILAKVETLKSQLSVALDSVNNTPSYVHQRTRKGLE